jgi:hypothetical protein
MKHLFAIVAAVAAVVAALIRLAVGDGDADLSESDEATPIPPITAKQVEKLAYAGASDRDIADRFLIDEARVREKYANVLIPARAVRRISLYGLQFDLARKLNGPMLIWLGKNELRQANRPEDPDDTIPGTTDD